MNEAEYQAEVQRWLKYVQEDLRAAESFLSKKLFVNKGFDPPKSPLSRGASDFWIGSLLIKEG